MVLDLAGLSVRLVLCLNFKPINQAASLEADNNQKLIILHHQYGRSGIFIVLLALGSLAGDAAFECWFSVNLALRPFT